MRKWGRITWTYNSKHKLAHALSVKASQTLSKVGGVWKGKPLFWRHQGMRSPKPLEEPPNATESEITMVPKTLSQKGNNVHD